MLIAFETENSKTLSKYLSNFLAPDSTFIEVMHNFTFTNKKITRIENIVIINTQSIFHVFAKFAALPSVTLILLGLYFSSTFMIATGSILLLLSLLMLSRSMLLSLIIIKLKFSGHKQKIKYVSDSYLIEKLLYVMNNGTTGSIRTFEE